MNIANYIDHTILRPDCTVIDVERLCGEADKHAFKAVCVPPYFVKKATDLLSDKMVKVATVVGFPMGYSATAAKVEEIKRALNDGADEVDVVINIAAVKNKDWHYVRNDIDSATRAVHLRGKVVKLIIEASLLDNEEIQQVCKMIEEVGADFVKTSTGFNGQGATVDMVRRLRLYLPQSVKIKASGGIRTRDAAKQLISAGAVRLGCSASVAIAGDEARPAQESV